MQHGCFPLIYELEYSQMKRWLFEIHRWVGIALALFMLLWFFSGLLIVFAEPGTPSRAQQLANADSLLVEASWLSAGEAWQRSEAQRNALVAKKNSGGAEDKAVRIAGNKQAEVAGKSDIVEARLVRQAGEPLWLIEDQNGQRFALSAVDGNLHQTTVEHALQIAANWVNRNSGDADSAAVNFNFIETIAKPAILRNQEGLLPFHRIAVEDGAGSELLISARTGEVVHASTCIGRGMYWAGNWVHLFRPLELTGWGESRANILMWTGFAAVIAALTGLIVGWLRWRPGWLGKKTYSQGRVHPYRDVWFRWHFWGGLIGGTLALTWCLSGFLNGNPWQLFSPANASKEELARYVGNADGAATQAWHALSVAPEAGVVELVWRRLGNDSIVFANTRAGARVATPTSSAAQFSDAALLAAVTRLAGNVPIAKQSLLHEYDSYYYLRHHRDAADRPLPVLRVELADAAATHLYLDPQDGRLLIKQDSSRRVFRWLYSALHHWDFGWLYARPFWDMWMVVWVLFGLTLSVTAVVVGSKRLVQTLRPKHRKATQAKAHAVNEAGALTSVNQAG